MGKNKYFTLYALFVGLMSVSGCMVLGPTSQLPVGVEEAIRQMDMKEKEANRRVDQRWVSQMSLRALFPDSETRTLAAVAGRGRVQQIETLVAQGVDINARGSRGATPLYWPLRRGNVAGFKELLEQGADPNAIYEDGTSIMYFAASENNLSFLSLALEYGGDPNLVSGGRIISRVDGEIVTRFVGETPIIHAVMHNKNAIEAVDMLLGYGANINALASSNQTPLIISTSVLRYDVTLALLERGADYTLKASGNGRTWSVVDVISLHKYELLLPSSKAMQQLEKVVEWLAERGVDIPSPSF